MMHDLGTLSYIQFYLQDETLQEKQSSVKAEEKTTCKQLLFLLKSIALQ